jgi:sugar phosphate isomerase/epimerase
MKLGAQLYSVRDVCQDAAGLKETCRRLKEIGYDAVQISGIGPRITPEEIAAITKEFDLAVPTTHIAFDRLVGDTDAVIAEHRLFGAKEIGIGGLGRIADLATARERFDAIREATKKIEAAGMKFGFHNHWWEFSDIGGDSMYEVMINEYPEFNFIHDVYWTTYAGLDPVAYIHRLKGRIVNIHFKDMLEPPQGPICPCGAGIIDMKAIYDACIETGVSAAFVEQDNAPDSGDSVGQMAISYQNLAPIFGR